MIRTDINDATIAVLRARARARVRARADFDANALDASLEDEESKTEKATP